ncbi:hypothetical protein JTE90_017418 [Oedothorax gibbosus]|uniref:Trafficking protein particle complex subunit 9 n=1 Tax=Oedothorax gibbosus TaxID=931172 RepID=A0AAV6U7F1_9ARAC|nr:hypothetical protein JTE90_017418 [Oedothorax gibbosus]
MKLKSYTTHVLGVRSECRLREVGCVRAPLFCVEVVGRLPSALLSTSLPRASTFSSLEDASDVVASAYTTLHNGQSQECVITITNAGNEPVEWVDISMHSKLKKDMETLFFTWDKEEINSQLPIPAGGVAHLTLHINAIGPFILEKPGNPVPLSSASPRRRGEPVLQPPEPFAAKTVEAVLQVQYSGGPGMRGGHCRQGSVALTVEVLPSLVITEWNVLPSEVPTHCYLVLDMQNGAAVEMEVAYAQLKRILIEAGDKCRVPVPVQRCSLAALSSMLGAEWASVDICGHLWTDEKTDSRKATLLSACRRHLHNEVDLQWTLPALEISGKASISEITWTEDMLGFILMSPLRWDVRINEKDFQPEMEFNFLLGELVTFSIKLLNVSDVPLLNLNLFVRGYQDYQNGRQSYRLETKRAVSGKDRIHIEEIKPGEEFLHACGFVFFHSGAYKVDILCSHNDPLLDSGVHPCLIQKCSPTLDLTILED